MKQTIIIWMLVALGLTIGMFIEISVSAPQWGSVQGTVTDGVSGNPVPGATVTISPGGSTRSTDPKGHFLFERLNPGTYAVTVSAAGFADGERKGLTLAAGSSIEISISLRSTRERRDKQSAGEVLVPRTVQERKPTVADPIGLGKVQSNGLSPAQNSYNQPADNSSGSADYKKDLLRRPVPPPLSTRQEFEYQTLPPYDMYFHDFGTNAFVETRRDRFSTFGADIDDASFTLVRRYLNEGNMPPTDAVRVEEFVNHFDYGYNPPEEGKFRIFSEMAASPFDRNTSYLKIGIKGREVTEARRKPIALTAVIDVSGSMGYDNRFEIVRESMRLLSERLDARDKIAIVAYGSFATLVLSSTSGDHQDLIVEAMNQLHPGGSTFAEAGLRLGYQTANDQYTEGYNNLVILLSDGVANVGRTSPDAIMAQIKQFARKGLTLSTFGYGMGNYNDVLLEQLAQQGNGSYAYIDTYDQAKTLFADQLVNTVQTLARDVKIQVEFNPSTVLSYRLLGYEKRAIPDQQFRNNSQDGGEVKAGHEVTALYEIVLNRRGDDRHVATVNVRWKNLAQDEVTEVSQEVELNRGLSQFESARPEFRLAVVAARFAETLKQTQFSDGSFDRLLALARRISYDRSNNDTLELVSLIERAQSLSIGYGGYQED